MYKNVLQNIIPKQGPRLDNSFEVKVLPWNKMENIIESDLSPFIKFIIRDH